MKMTAYNNLKIAILAILASQSIHAITIEPVQVQSAPGELLYAEMNFQQSNTEVPLQVGLASNEDLLSLGGAAQQVPAHLNFFVRRSQTGNGVITITSTQPISASELNLVLKIQEGNATQLKRVKTILKRPTVAQPKVQPNPHEKPLAPIRIVNEQEIALNLPLAASSKIPPALTPAKTPVAQPAAVAEKPAIAPAPKPATPTPAAPVPAVTAARPLPQSSSVASMGGTTITTTIRGGNQSEAQTKVVHSVVKAEPVAEKQPKQDVKAKDQKAATDKKAIPEKTEKKPTANAQQAQYVVQSKDTLWNIASKIAAEQKRPINDVLQDIQRKNAAVFANRSIDRLQLGMVLDLDIPSNGVAKGSVKPSTKNAEKPVEKAKAVATKPAISKEPTTKYRLNEAEMSLVAEDKNKAVGNKGEKNLAVPHALAPNVMTARQKSVTLQKNVTQLELALNKKDNRIQILNARLAELQQQLQAQQAKHKSTK